jgi:hypothetical protein
MERRFDQVSMKVPRCGSLGLLSMKIYKLKRNWKTFSLSACSSWKQTGHLWNFSRYLVLKDNECKFDRIHTIDTWTNNLIRTHKNEWKIWCLIAAFAVGNVSINQSGFPMQEKHDNVRRIRDCCTKYNLSTKCVSLGQKILLGLSELFLWQKRPLFLSRIFQNYSTTCHLQSFCPNIVCCWTVISTL